jgi:hypothetical protein
MKTLYDLEVGDTVAFCNRYTRIGFDNIPIWQKATVTACTKTRLTVNGQVFMRSTGSKVGENKVSMPTTIKPWSNDMADQIDKINRAIADDTRRWQLYTSILDVNLRYLSLGKLERIVTIIEESE